MRFVKNFYTKYPQFKFISFRDLRGISREQFAKDISELCCMVWIDDISSFGTVPVESMKCNVPVIGRIPDMVPDWMTDTNGYWSHSTNNLIDITYKFVQAWLEDAEPAEIYEEMEKMKGEYTIEKQKTVMTEVYERMINNRIEEFKLSLPQEEEGEVIEISEVDNKEEVKEN
jgi:hypothetical protein